MLEIAEVTQQVEIATRDRDLDAMAVDQALPGRAQLRLRLRSGLRRFELAAFSARLGDRAARQRLHRDELHVAVTRQHSLDHPLHLLLRRALALLRTDLRLGLAKL